MKLQFDSPAEKIYSFSLLAIFAPVALGLIFLDMRNGTELAVRWIIPLGIPIALARTLFEEYRIYDPACGELRFMRRLFFIGRSRVEARAGQVLRLELSVWPAATPDEPLRRMTAPFFVLDDGRRLRAGNDRQDGAWTREEFIDTAKRLGLRWSTSERKDPVPFAPSPEPKDLLGMDASPVRVRGGSSVGRGAGTEADPVEPLELPIERDAPSSFIMRWIAFALFTTTFLIGLKMQIDRGGGHYGEPTVDPLLILLFKAGLIFAVAHAMRETVVFDFARGRIVRIPRTGKHSSHVELGKTSDVVAVGLTTQWSLAWRGTRYWFIHLLLRDGQTFALSSSSTDHDALELYGKKLARRLGVPLVDGRRELEKPAIWPLQRHTDHPLAVERAGGTPRLVRMTGFFGNLLHGHLLPGFVRPGIDLLLWLLYVLALFIFASVHLARL